MKPMTKEEALSDYLKQHISDLKIITSRLEKILDVFDRYDEEQEKRKKPIFEIVGDIDE